MMDYIAKFFLLFSNDLIIVPLIVIGIIWAKRPVFYQAACLIFISILLNVALKNTFQIPLSPALGKVGYAFPSGHMQLATVLYTWLALTLKKRWLSRAVIVVLSSIGMSLIHFGYHNSSDVLAAVFVASLLLLLYYVVNVHWPKKLSWYLLGTASLLLIYIALTTVQQIAAQVWMAYYALWGLILAENVAEKRIVNPTRAQKLIATLLCFTVVGLIEIFFHYLVRQKFSLSIFQLQWLVIGFVIPCVNFFATDIVNQFQFCRAKN